MEQANAQTENEHMPFAAQAAESDKKKTDDIKEISAPDAEKPTHALTLEDRIAALEAQLARQNELMARQTTLLEKQERRALYRKIWLGAKIALVAALALWLGPKVYAAWMQYQAFLAQVEAFVTQIDGFTGDVESFIRDVRTQVSTLSQTLSGLQDSFGPLTTFLAKFGM
jgi:ferric-dicitrate binding protein FerR (iron transport regulator)